MDTSRFASDHPGTLMWPDPRALSLLGIEHPIIQAPMAGVAGPEMVVAVSEAGGLGSLPCALSRRDRVKTEVLAIRRGTRKPVNLNFFCHGAPRADPARDAAWRRAFAPYYAELGIAPDVGANLPVRAPFDAAMCDVALELAPEVVSFHFGLPEPSLVERLRKAGAKILCSATTVREARRLEDEGCDAIIAQGVEAGGHRGHFLSMEVAGQVGTMALVPQVVDAVKVPVIAAGGIADARGIVAALALGASAVQMGTAYLFCPEATLSTPHRQALRAARDEDTVLTNVFTGRAARSIGNRLVREVGPFSELAPDFPLAAAVRAPLGAQAEARGSGDFSPLWAGQTAPLGRAMPAGELTRTLAAEALAKLTAR